MKVKIRYALLFLITQCAFKISDGIEPLSWGVAAVTGLTGAGIFAGYEYVKCKFKECCSDLWIVQNLTGLQESFSTKLHGQHLVKDIVMPVVRNHLRGKASKPLVLSFHGWTGSGKNHVSNLIAEHLYKLGHQSQYVTTYVATVHFPLEEDIYEYRALLRKTIREKVSECPYSLFIFDEVDKMPPGLMDAIKPYLDYYTSIDGVDYRKSIFIFLSNTGGGVITDITMNFWNNGSKREKITLKDMEDAIHQGAFNEAGGFSKSSIVEKNLIDFYIPFLPLERRFVKLCARDEFLKNGFNPLPKHLDWIADQMAYTPSDTQLFSKSGCKKVEQKVALWIELNDG